MLGIVTGLAAEARIARPLGLVAVGGGGPDGARRAAERLISRGATSLISFGVAGGLDPALEAGALVVPARVVAGATMWRADTGLTVALGGPTATTLLACAAPVVTARERAALFAATGAVAADLESGAVAEAAQARGLTFGVLRAVCDPAWADLPPAALKGLTRDGRFSAARVVVSALAAPRQIGALMTLAGQMREALRALEKRVREVGALASDPRF